MVLPQEFHISVTLVGQNDYLVRTEQVAPGVPLAEELVTWPVAEWLATAGNLINDPLQSVLQGDMFAINSVNLVALGQQLYNALFQGTLRDSWITAQGIAQNQQQVLRLRLGLKDTRLASLPWEVMHAGDRPLATGPYIAFSRYQSGIPAASLPTHKTPTSQDTKGVKVLMVISAPTDQVRLDLLKQEAINLQAELHRQPSRLGTDNQYVPEIELTVLDQPGREELTQALEQGRYHILHYSGHSNVGANGGEIYLVSRKTGLTEILSGDDLAGLLVNNNIQMAVFNSCLGAYSAKSDGAGDTAERNLTESLVKRGIRSVLAMSERIPDEVALTLTQLFYRNLNQGYSLDLCVSRVRQGLISAYGSHQMYWALPVLYLQREFDGFLTAQGSGSGHGELLNEYQIPVVSTTNSFYSPLVDDIEMTASFDSDPLGLDWVGEDAWDDLGNDIEYDESSYDEDSAIVSDLLRQLNHPSEVTDSTLTAELLQPQDDEEDMQVMKVEEALSLWGETPASAAPTVLDLETPPLTSSLPPSNRPKRPKKRPIWKIIGVVGSSAIALTLVISWWQYRNSGIIADIPTIPTENLAQQNHKPINLQTSPTGMVTASATALLSQGNLQAGLEAVDALLSRGALADAETALDLIPPRLRQDAEVNFLRGRLAWQLVQKGEEKYSIDDARRYWEVAVRDRPDSVVYNNALGFAYYAEGNLNRANDAWFKALNLALNSQQNTSSSTASQIEIPSEALTAYAGLALGLYKSANNQDSSKQQQYINEAIKLRQMVIQKEPVNFTVDKLSHNWLWTEQAIADWRSLLQTNQ
ncbi:heterocyst differentiation protein HetF [Richelia sinica FACHB-800]|uniref:Heterocyst differentiation protein HetF n=1 Tax=Richelia sinica FACHB-800 TaxID=1357546 RepID=A0A975T986_9NOST|nr:cell division protein HetF [Richelia sinica]MBD2663397.1 CHAT domain-containing protein [Richelia sinica FACHB-800]QXE24576.1 heterocyst differentiation protein HetF [Richelia sinica FACHB-800]